MPSVTADTVIIHNAGGAQPLKLLSDSLYGLTKIRGDGFVFNPAATLQNGLKNSITRSRSMLENAEQFQLVGAIPTKEGKCPPISTANCSLDD